MHNILSVVFLFLIHASLAQPAQTIRLADLEAMMEEGSSEIHIINFWATWCGPCVKELPYFEKITAEGNDNIKVSLVSLDLDLNPNPEKVYQFIRKKKLQSEVWLLDEPDPNAWISKIHPEWSGALPATMLINHKTGERKFIGRALREGELEQYLNEFQ